MSLCLFGNVVRKYPVYKTTSTLKQEEKYKFVYKDGINCKPSFPLFPPFVFFNSVAGIKMTAGTNSYFYVLTKREWEFKTLLCLRHVLFMLTRQISGWSRICVQSLVLFMKLLTKGFFLFCCSIIFNAADRLGCWNPTSG